MMSTILDVIDAFICGCIGLDSEESKPNRISQVNGRLLISNTEPYKRHLYVQKVEDFLRTDLERLSNENKGMLGVAMGRSMAKNLTISFGGTELNEVD